MLFGLFLLLTGSSDSAVVEASYQVQVSVEVQSLIREAKAGDSETLVADLEVLSEGGDASATELLGEVLSFGLFGIAADRPRACSYFEQLADHDPLGAHNFATCHFDGSLPDASIVQARHYYQLASQGGYPKAHCAYGNMLIHGQGGSYDRTEGLALCAKGAELGEADAQTDLGGYLLTGRLTRRDPVEARRMLELAAAQGQANACFLLAQIYLKGDGIAADPALAERLFLQSYRAGRADAAWQVTLILVRRGYRQSDGEMFVNATVLEEAREWALRAAANDPTESRRQEAADMATNLAKLIATGRTGAASKPGT